MTWQMASTHSVKISSPPIAALSLERPAGGAGLGRSAAAPLVSAVASTAHPEPATFAAAPAAAPLAAAAAAAAGIAAAGLLGRRRGRGRQPVRAALAAVPRRRETLVGVGAAALLPLPARAEAEPPTVVKQAAEGVWIFDQAFGIPGLGVGANIPVRMTVLQLEGGGVLVYNPCNPTSYCLQKLEEAGLTDVRYIVCGTIAVEHKYYSPQWAARFPNAEVWISPRTFSFPVNYGANVPLVGFPKGKKLNKIPKDATAAPWYSQGMDHLQLTVDYAPRTVFEETVMFHRPSGTFVCTDMLISLSDDPPEILTKSPYREGLVYFSRDTPLQSVDIDSEATLRDGYQKGTLLLNNINPRSLLSVAAGDLQVPDIIGLAFKAPQKQIGYFGWYPCDWQVTDAPCAKLETRQGNGAGSKPPECRPGWRGEWRRLAAGIDNSGIQVPSFVAELQISRDPEAVRSFAAAIAEKWPGIQRVVSSHFASPVPTTAEKVRRAISAVADGPPGPPARTADLSAILNFKDYLEENGLIYIPESGRGQWKAA
mmetsp:Transcript_33182/g.72375  ORF Transcript_33182/g.72375 Transcript_33182/m.72375 type:complete len:539 (+) Transcript_33182:36-1652(+)